MNITSKTTKADLEAYIAELEAKLAAQSQVNTQVEATVTTPIQPVAQPTFTFVAPTNEVTIVYCSDSLGFASVSNMELHFNRYGEKFVLSRSQFDELVGKYRRWFERGILAVAYENIEVAASKGLPTDKEIGLTATILNSLGNMSAAQIEQLWNNTPVEEHRRSIVCFVKRKFIEGDNSYRNREKIDLLNRLTNGGFKREQDELDGRIKIVQTDM